MYILLLLRNPLTYYSENNHKMVEIEYILMQVIDFFFVVV